MVSKIGYTAGYGVIDTLPWDQSIDTEASETLDEYGAGRVMFRKASATKKRTNELE